MNTENDLPPSLARLLPRALQDAANPFALQRGVRLFDQGAVPERMFYVVRGEVVLERHEENGARVVLQRVREGFLAEASLEVAAYHCDALITESGIAVALPLRVLRRELAHDPGFALRWIGMLSGEIRRLRMRCERMALKGVEARLLHLIDTEGHEGRLLLTSTLKSLAGDLGVTHEALYRELARLERAGKLALSAGELVALR